ncbi:MAG: hypothetical protein ACLP1X_14020 [Polyangiaceae bacterium]
MTRQWTDRRFAALIVLAYLPVAIFATVHHEMWRDEVHCWLVARDSATPWAVVHNRAYDGQPPLWYLVLWVLEKTTHDPVTMRIVHVAIAAAAAWVFAERAPFSRPLRAIFPFGYFLAYEYVALSRCYGLALFLALLLCVHHPRRRTHPATLALLVAALALTTTVATLVAAAYVAALATEGLVVARRGDRLLARTWIPIAAGAGACLAAALCAWPPADSTVAHVSWPTALPDDTGPTRLIAAMVPIPRVDFFFWNSNALLSYEPFARVAFPVALGLAAWIVLLLSRDVVAAVLFGVGTLLLVALFGLVYPGDVRHHGFFFVLLLMGAWIAKDSAPTAPPPPGWRWWRDAGLTPTLAAVLALHVAAAPIALYYDYKYVFSSGRRAADALCKAGLLDSLLVAEVDYPTTAVLGQLGPQAVAYSPRTGRTFSFVRWTRDRRRDPTDAETLRFTRMLADTHGREATLLMNRPLLPELVDGENVTRVAELYDSMIEEENFYIYRVARPPPER